jgi:phosphatidylethanolamine-binding protein (PEBP) family uncharacterized protein
MPRQTHVISSAAILAVLALLTGCGTANSTRKTIAIPFQSPDILNGRVPVKNTCDGKNIAPTLEWGEIPSGANEVALFLLGLTPSGGSGGASISIEWAVAGIKTSVHRITAGHLPHGALVGSDTSGAHHYSVCPGRGKVKTYEFAVYAVPAAVKPTPGFKGIQLLGELASSNSPTVASAAGQFTAQYKRKA